MGIADAELLVQRRLTRAFLVADSSTITLYRSVFAPDGAGGSIRQPPTPLTPQVMRLIPLGDGASERLTADGEAVTPNYMLLGLHDADMERWDEFTHEGYRYEVVFVNQNRQYETKGEVVYRG